ncbi:hypothetical protein TNCV_3714891 [Trichonephila clavipes]|nr:hypothetical protein TNCV_3714891 [Trichonephila clavipes]
MSRWKAIFEQIVSEPQPGSNRWRLGPPVCSDACPDYQTVVVLFHVKEQISTPGLSPDENTSRFSIQNVNPGSSLKKKTPTSVLDNNLDGHFVVHSQRNAEYRPSGSQATCIKSLGNCFS